MSEPVDDAQLALRHLSYALQALDRTEHAQVGAMTSHALEMLRSAIGMAVPAPPVISIGFK